MKKYVLSALIIIVFSLNQLFGQSPPPSDAWTLRRKVDNDGYVRCGDQRKFDSAIFYAKDIEMATKLEFGDSSVAHAGTLCGYLGYVYMIKGDYPNAYLYLKKGLGIWDHVTDSTHFGYNDAVFRLGIAANGLGLRAEAEKYLYRSTLLFKKTEKEAQAQIMLQLAGIFCEKGDYEKAVSLNMKVNDLIDTIHNNAFIDYLKASLYNNMAAAYSQTDNWKKTFLYLRKALVLERITAKKANTPNDYLQVMLNLAEAYTNANLPDSAMIVCKEVEDSLTKNKNDLIYALTLVERAKVCEQKKESRKALGIMQQYKAIADTLVVKPDNYDANIIELGALYTANKLYARADSLFKQEIGQLHQSGLDFSYEMQQCKANLCVNLMNQKKYNEASDSLVNLVQLTLQNLKKNFAGMSESELLQYKNALDVVFDLLYTCIFANKNTDKHILSETGKLELEREGMVLANQAHLLNEARNTHDTALNKFYTDWINNRQLLAHQYALPIGERLFSTDSLEEICEVSEKKMSLRGFAPNLVGNNIQATKIPFNDMKAQTCGIAFVRFNYQPSTTRANDLSYAAFIYKPNNTAPTFVRLCNEAALVKLFKNKQGKWIDAAQLTQNIYSNNSATASLLYHLLWQPLEPFLKDVKNIGFSTAGMLNNIAFQALHNGKNYLYQQYGLRRYLSLLDAGKQQETYQAKEEITIWGNIDYETADYNAIPTVAPQAHVSILSSDIIASTATKKGAFKEKLQPLGNTEVYNLKKICASGKIPFTSFEQQMATEDNFKQQAANTKGILHISTHGFYMPFKRGKEKSHGPADFMAGITNPLFRCGLAFSGVNYYWLKGKMLDNRDDGILTGYEISQLDLHQIQLVTLSACETGLGDITDNEGNIGLQRAFKLAGAGKLLVSLWQVPAKQTAELFSLFYTNRLSGQPIDKALQLAQDALQKKQYPPYYWAGFVLIE